MVTKKLLQCILAAALAVGACGDDGDDPTPAAGADAGGAGGACEGLTYANFAEPLFRTQCTMCHGMTSAASLGAMIVLDTLPAVKARKEDIIEHAVKLEEPKMPFGTSGLPQETRTKLEKWLNCGAP